MRPVLRRNTPAEVVMGFETISVVLEPHQPVYFSGQTLRGFVRTSANKAVSCQDITVYVKGKAKVYWNERCNHVFHPYTAEEKYFKIKCKPWRGAENDNKVPPGQHSFPFSAVLPSGLPSSFESSVGRVRYEVTAEAERPRGSNQSASTYFSVNGIYDLNSDPISSNHMYGKDSLSSGQGPIRLVMEAQRTGYVAGENIVLNGEVVNHSRHTIKYAEAKIVQKITYITPGKSRIETRTVQRVYRPQIVPGGRDKWAGVPLPVPAVPSSHLQHCHIIEIDYYFQLVARLDSRRAARLEIPIVIGSIPLQGALSTQLPRGREVALGVAMMPTFLTTPQPYFNAPPMPQSTLLLPNAPQRSRSQSVSQLLSALQVSDNDPPSSQSASRLPSAPWLFNDDPPPYTDTMLPEEYKDVPPPTYASCAFSGGQTHSLDRRGPSTLPRPHQMEESSDNEGRFAPHYITYGMV